MLHKLKQQTQRYKLTASNRLPDRRARQFLANHIRTLRLEKTSPYLRASMGLLRWKAIVSFHGEDRISFRSGCFISGRARGTSQRFTVARTKIKHLSDAGQLIGVRKSSF